MRRPLPLRREARHWRAWLIALLFVCGQFGGWLHFAAHHADKTVASASASATFLAPDAAASADANPDDEDETCPICLGLASLFCGLVGRCAVLRLTASPLHRDSAPPVRLTALAALTPLARGPPRFS